MGVPTSPTVLLLVNCNSSVKCIRLESCAVYCFCGGDLAAPPAGDDIAEVVRQGQRRTAMILSLRLGDGDALALALKDVLPLELGHGGEHGQHELTGRGGGVDRLLLGDELNLLGGQLLDELQQVAGVAGKAADRLDDHGVARADVVHHAL